MKVTRLYTNSDGCSAFEDFEINLERVSVELFPGQKAEQNTTLKTPNGMVVNETDAGHQYDWHNAPAKQWVITLQGEIEVKLRNGESKRFDAGSMLLAEDVSGSGHATSVTSNVSWRCIYLPFST